MSAPEDESVVSRLRPEPDVSRLVPVSRLPPDSREDSAELQELTPLFRQEIHVWRDLKL